MIKISCPNPEFYFAFEVDNTLIDCDAKVLPAYNIDPVTGNAISGCCGIVKFKPGALRSGIIAHESTHMALAYLRMLNKNIILSDGCDDTEELISYTIGHFASKLTEIYWESSEFQIKFT